MLLGYAQWGAECKVCYWGTYNGDLSARCVTGVTTRDLGLMSRWQEGGGGTLGGDRVEKGWMGSSWQRLDKD